MKRAFSFAGLLLAATVLLSACGFHLRGSSPQDMLPFKTIHFAFPENSSLAVELKRNLRGGGTIVVPNRKDAEASLELLAEKKNKGILSLNVQGRVREYELTYILSFQVKDRTGKILLPPNAVAQKRTLNYSETQVLGKEVEEAELYRDMQTDLVQQIIRRMAAIKIPPASSPPQNAAPARKS
ncbi:MAG: LPS assembly lipoprotein LptE [Burkholderiaceae bacterium]|nr:LPS assembly lipoprotein LptE [Burkholderiaceae bacterium]